MLMVTYNRNINVIAENINENLIRASAKMGNKASGELGSENFRIDVIVDRNNFEIKKVENVIINGILPCCSKVISKMQSVVGTKIEVDYLFRVSKLAGGKDGCIHMVELLIEIGRCVHQANSFYNVKNKGMEQAFNDYSNLTNFQCFGINRFNEQDLKSMYKNTEEKVII